MSSFAKTCFSNLLLLIALAIPVFAGGCQRQSEPPVTPRSLGADAAASPQAPAAGTDVAQVAPPPVATPAARANDPAPKVDDAKLTTQVKAALKDDPDTRGLKIDVETKDAQVTLKGALEHQDQVTHAVDVARSVAGVRDVVNRLSVKGEDKAAHSTQG